MDSATHNEREEDSDWVWSPSVVTTTSMEEEAEEEGEEEAEDPGNSGANPKYTYNRPIDYLHRTHNLYGNRNSRNANLDNPIPRSERAVLCEKMLEAVANSVKTFKPSVSICALKSMKQQVMEGAQGAQGAQGGTVSVPDIEIDLVMSGGGLKGYFMAGATYILLHELEKQNVRIARVAGASAGAWAGFFLLTGFSSADWLETYFGCARNLDKTLLEAYRDMWPFVSTLIPDDAHKHCTGRLFISVTEVTRWGLRNRMISRYDSNEELFEACLASSTIPFLTERNGIREFKNMWVCDGGFTNNTPIFEDGVRRQLVFKLYDVEYPWRLLTTASDSCIEALVLRGAILMSRFLQGDASEGGGISWLERRDTDKLTALPSRPSVLFSLFAQATISGMLAVSGARRLLVAVGLLRTGGGDNAIKRNKKIKNNGEDVIPFEEAQKERAKDSTSSFLRFLLWSGVVEFLRERGLLL